jgi:DnaK suppressor protein
VAFERAQVAALLDQAKQDLTQLNEAEARIKAGTYGRCANCGDTISDGRLEALPATTTCIRCA